MTLTSDDIKRIKEALNKTYSKDTTESAMAERYLLSQVPALIEEVERLQGRKYRLERVEP